MSTYYRAIVQVIIDGTASQVETVMGQGYNPNIVKQVAEGRVRIVKPEVRITSIILQKEDLTLEQYTEIAGRKPQWLSGPNGE